MANEKIGTIRMRMSTHDAHYAGNLVDGARLIGLISDAGTELQITLTGNEGLLAAWHHIEQYVPVYLGDYLEVRTWFSRYGNTSADMEGAIYKVCEFDEGDITSGNAHLIDPPVLVMRASATGVTPKAVNRGPQIDKKLIPYETAGEIKWWETKKNK